MENLTEIEEKFGILITDTEVPNRYIITSMQSTTYSFLQRLQQFKGYLKAQGKQYTPISRLAEDIVVMEVK